MIANTGCRWDGIYCINTDGSGAFEAFCDMTKDCGGWTVFQRRVDDSVDFYRNWTEYSAGFGDLEGNLWIGLDKLHAMTAAYSTELHVYINTFENESAWAQYSSFSVGDAASKYVLSLGGYSGTAGNGMARSNGENFSTKDEDNDASPSVNCAKSYLGAFWYEACHDANPNGFYYHGAHSSFADGINWHQFRGLHYSMKTITMKLRRLQ